MKKAVILFLTACFSLFGTGSVFAQAPQTGATAPLVPLFVGLMIFAVVAIIVCLVLLKKKK